MNIVIYIFYQKNISLYLIDNIYLLMIKSYSLLFATKRSLNREDEFNNKNKLINKCLKPNIKNITPRKIYDNIHLKRITDKIMIDLKDGKRIYGFLCKIDNKLYIGSSENLIKRFKEHIKGRKSNIRLQRAIKKYGLNNFCFIIFEFYNLNDKALLTDFETTYISYFNFESLYNFKLIGQSMLGYKHSPSWSNTKNVK